MSGDIFSCNEHLKDVECSYCKLFLDVWMWVWQVKDSCLSQPSPLPSSPLCPPPDRYFNYIYKLFEDEGGFVVLEVILILRPAAVLPPSPDIFYNLRFMNIFEGTRARLSRGKWRGVSHQSQYRDEIARIAP